MKRLFLGVQPEKHIIEGLVAYQQALLKCPPLRGHKARPVLPENIHLTLHFLGAVEPEKQKALEELLPRVQNNVPMCQKLDAFMAFPSSNAFRVAGLGATVAEPMCLAIWACLREILRECALPVEDRRFIAHITLVRFGSVVRPISWDSLPPPAKLMLGISTICLYQSHLGPGGSRYEIIKQFPLGCVS